MAKLIWYFDNQGVLLPKGNLFICGQSGSGKTALSDYLCKVYEDDFEIVPNCTTRRARNSSERHFRFMSEDEFISCVNSNEFFMYRSGDKIKYGYLKSDYNSIIQRNKIPIFMFRLSGLEQLSDKLSNCYICIIQADIERSLLYSEDINAVRLADESRVVSDKLNKYISENNMKNPLFVIRNEYNDSFFKNFVSSSFFLKLLDLV